MKNVENVLWIGVLEYCLFLKNIAKLLTNYIFSETTRDFLVSIEVVGFMGMLIMYVKSTSFYQIAESDSAVDHYKCC